MVLKSYLGAVTVLDAVSKKYGHKFNYQEVYMGGCAIDKYGVPLPQETVDICKKSDSVLLGAVGGPKWDSQPSENRPEKGLLGIRKALELYSNLRPSILKPQLKDASPLKDEKLEKGLNVMVVRELTGGIYFGERKKAEDGSWASDTEKYSVESTTVSIRKTGKNVIMANEFHLWSISIEYAIIMSFAILVEDFVELL